MALKPKSRWYYQKRIEELERDLAAATDKLYQYRSAVIEIYDEIATPPDGASLRPGWILGKIKRCLR